MNKALMLKDLQAARALNVLQHGQGAVFDIPDTPEQPLCACVLGYLAVGSGLADIPTARIMALGGRDYDPLLDALSDRYGTDYKGLLPLIHLNDGTDDEGEETGGEHATLDTLAEWLAS